MFRRRILGTGRVGISDAAVAGGAFINGRRSKRGHQDERQQRSCTSDDAPLPASGKAARGPDVRHREDFDVPYQIHPRTVVFECTRKQPLVPPIPIGNVLYNGGGAKGVSAPSIAAAAIGTPSAGNPPGTFATKIKGRPRLTHGGGRLSSSWHFCPPFPITTTEAMTASQTWRTNHHEYA